MNDEDMYIVCLELSTETLLVPYILTLTIVTVNH
jgi:hypothetical protein